MLVLDLDPIHPTQFASLEVPDRQCRLLVAAVLERAILDLHATASVLASHNAAERPAAAARLRAETAAWFLATDRTWPLTFVNCCETLGLEPDQVRAKLRGLFVAESRRYRHRRVA